MAQEKCYRVEFSYDTVVYVPYGTPEEEVIAKAAKIASNEVKHINFEFDSGDVVEVSEIKPR